MLRKCRENSLVGKSNGCNDLSAISNLAGILVSHTPLNRLVSKNHLWSRNNFVILTVLLYSSAIMFLTVNSPELFLGDIESSIEISKEAIADSTVDICFRARKNYVLNLIVNCHISLALTSDDEFNECAGNDVITMHKVNSYDRHTANASSYILTFGVLNSTEDTLLRIKANNFLLLVNNRLAVRNLITSLSYRESICETELLKIENLVVRYTLNTIFLINNGEAGSNERTEVEILIVWHSIYISTFLSSGECLGILVAIDKLELFYRNLSLVKSNSSSISIETFLVGNSES